MKSTANIYIMKLCYFISIKKIGLFRLLEKDSEAFSLPYDKKMMKAFFLKIISSYDS
jgi:hypothetical protein